MKTEKEESGPLFVSANPERRKHPRVAVNLLVEYRRGDESRNRIGCTGDISEGGALLHLPERVEVGEEIWLRLFVDGGFDFLCIEATVQVVWKALKNVHDGGRWVGVKFIDISTRDMHNLKTLLASLAHLRIPSEIPSRLLVDLGVPLQKVREGMLRC